MAVATLTAERDRLAASVQNARLQAKAAHGYIVDNRGDDDSALLRLAQEEVAACIDTLGDAQEPLNMAPAEAAISKRSVVDIARDLGIRATPSSAEVDFVAPPVMDEDPHRTDPRHGRVLVDADALRWAVDFIENTGDFCSYCPTQNEDPGACACGAYGLMDRLREAVGLDAAVSPPPDSGQTCTVPSHARLLEAIHHVLRGPDEDAVLDEAGETDHDHRWVLWMTNKGDHAESSWRCQCGETWRP
jgi:hypothetical protein